MEWHFLAAAGIGLPLGKTMLKARPRTRKGWRGTAEEQCRSREPA